MDILRKPSQHYDFFYGILSSTEFSRGCKFLRPLDGNILSSHNSGRASLFKLSTGLFSSKLTELLALFEGVLVDGDARIAQAAIIASGIADCKHITCICDKASTSARDIAGIHYEFISYHNFYKRLITLPDDFGENLRTISAIQRQGEFDDVYQERQARVRSIPGQPDDHQHVVSLKHYFHEWLSDWERRSPILLLGDRGWGKSWQMLRFALDANELHRQHPLVYGPAFFIRLKDIEEAINLTLSHYYT